MEYFNYRESAGGRELFAEDVALSQIAERFGTPSYVYSSAAFAARYRAFSEAVGDALVCYSVKANDNLAVLRCLGQEGAGVDIVSGGELARALAADIAPDKIVFAGVGKTASEMADALDAGIRQFNVESEEELEMLAGLAAARGCRAPVALRVNPDVDAKTHDKISTGRAQDKFGIEFDQAEGLYDRASKMAGIDMRGLAIHIGSQLTALAPFEAAFARLGELCLRLRAGGHAVSHLDLGGGLGISYDDKGQLNLTDYGALVQRTGDTLGASITLEPGRWMAGPAGLLLTRVVRVKRNGNKQFVIVDMAMNDLLRPALYGAWHDIQPVIPRPGDALPVDIVGPICESGDVIAKDRALPELRTGDLIAVRDAGAYGAVMSSSYNSRMPAAEVMVRGAESALIRPRLDYDAMLARDTLPDWQAGQA
ncbi:MAG: diaminopimelate decarboxylase [Rhodospirillaceae bacterium]|jgi:diaminopimelate decarboxylase|nr:diaminopimelate decarboxylase [Rhodospirillaceae bacterium]MBT3928544.1 diaminopimelate decarboxylase [Rhodospirillaceae bacterium]MBT5037089.1 diaminopimelate decarboxylase [Rhodospirillaceae bacterium]MBT6829272.1 diaminopimelate decarboxylase [Rhodospirillaceae bacterium]MBT7292459.1 diaminopimelate decarboxylase [Rhodospirillaceae bacterium]